MGSGRGRTRRVMAKNAGANVAEAATGGAWHATAKKLYKKGDSFRAVAEALRANGISVNEGRVREYLHTQDDVVIRASVKDYKAIKNIPEATPEILEARQLMAKAMKKSGASKDDVRMFLEGEGARYQPVVFHTYNDDPVFNEEKFLGIAANCIRDWHHATRNQVEGEGFEHFLARALTEAGYEVELAKRGNPGEDIRLKVQNQWVTISQKSENRNGASRDVISISSLAPHREDLDSPESCIRAVRAAAKHLHRSQRMLYLKAGESYFPEADFGEAGVDAQTYTMLEVPKDKLEASLKKLKPEDFKGEFSQGEDGSWQRKKNNTVNVPVRDDKGNKLFSVTLAKREGRVRIYSMNTAWCDLVNRMWTSAVGDTRAHN